MTVEQLQEHIERSFPDYVRDEVIFDRVHEAVRYRPNLEHLEVGSVYRFRAANVSVFDVFNAFRFAVITHERDEFGWVFSTLREPHLSRRLGESQVRPGGRHPVSGHRRFEVTTDGQGGAYFRTLGVDRPTGIPYGGQGILGQSDRVFEGADHTWMALQNAVIEDIHQRNGAAWYGSRFSFRVPWEYALPVFQGNGRE
ncbi:MAG: hypothetical protein JJU02_17110 [Cryomorphaceae bacterium]|nr:hypothetical protein [Cryomorphaceae bacterium]